MKTDNCLGQIFMGTCRSKDQPSLTGAKNKVHYVPYTLINVEK